MYGMLKKLPESHYAVRQARHSNEMGTPGFAVGEVRTVR